MPDNAQLIETFYRAFAARDFAAMIACYHPDVQFRDPVFLRLDHAGVSAMWEMLVSRSPDTRITFANVAANDTHGSATWTADYFFGDKRRPVHNVINARFRFADGKIVEHTDEFPLWKWAAMALGLPGAVFGWSGFMHAKIRAMAKAQLTKFRAISRS